MGQCAMNVVGLQAFPQRASTRAYVYTTHGAVGMHSECGAATWHSIGIRVPATWHSIGVTWRHVGFDSAGVGGCRLNLARIGW